MAQFVLELARGPRGAMSVLRPAVMSARPEGLDFLKVQTDSPMAAAMSARRGPHDPPTWDLYNAEAELLIPRGLRSYDYQEGGILRLQSEGGSGREFGLNLAGSEYGQLGDGLDFERMGDTKYRHFLDYFRSEQGADGTCVVFIGDDGQGDCNPAAAKMRSSAKPGGAQLGLRAAFIHRLACPGKRGCGADGHPQQAAPLIMFDTYLDAARGAEERGLISRRGLESVRAAVAAFFSAYCGAAGATRAPETVSQAGCQQLMESLAREGPVPAAPARLPRVDLRFNAFCGGCCSGARPSGAHDFKFDGGVWRCHNMYHKWSFFKFGMPANREACTVHCGPAR
mmetsp:Transcript_154740/g.475400  ORF Transcript_154740/g.475400 Transcript_154740/m.475400 type:complete len:340 (+) Transcript_154740:556-1575(+)